MHLRAYLLLFTKNFIPEMLTLTLKADYPTANRSMDDSKKNFGLSEVSFARYLEQLQSGDEALVQVIFKAHFERCRGFLMKELGATYDDAYDITKETLLKFRKNLIAGKIDYGNMAALFTIDARNNFFKMIEKRKKQAPADLDETVLNLPEVQDAAAFDEELVQHLKVALTKLCTDCRELLDWHYYLNMPQREIAEKRLLRGEVKFIQEDAVKSKLAECRKKLKKLL